MHETEKEKRKRKTAEYDALVASGVRGSTDIKGQDRLHALENQGYSKYSGKRVEADPSCVIS